MSIYSPFYIIDMLKNGLSDAIIEARMYGKYMTTLKLVNLMMRSSDNNPYTGKLSKKENTLAAIDLAKLCKNFADTGQTDEAMNIESSQWVEVIGILEGRLLNCA